MRAVLAGLVVALVAAACGAHPGSSDNGGTGSLDSLLARPGEDVAVVPGDADFSVGNVRYSFLVIRHDARSVERPRARVWLARSRSAPPSETATATLEQIGPPGSQELAAGGVGHIYVVHLQIRRPGTYWLVAEPVGAKVQAYGELRVARRSESPAVGSNAPRSDTPTLGWGLPISRLTTRIPPDRALLRYSVADSLAAHKPFVVTFATPRYCESRTCGPVVDVVDYVRRHSPSGIRFIHVEVYDRNVPSRGYNRWMTQWHLTTEPWTFLIGADGRIKAKFMGSVSARELEAAVDRFLLRAKRT